MNELTSSLQYGFSLHEKSLVNEDGGSRIRLRRIEPVDVYEFTVEGDELVSVAEAYSENVHGGNVTRRKIRSSVDGKDMEVVDIPKDDLLHIAPLQLGRNYWGRSIFRSAIGTSAYKVIYMYCDAIRQGRFSVPWLIGKLDKFDQRSSEDVSVLSKVMKMPATAIDRMLLFRKEDEIQAISPSGGTNILESVRYIDFSNSKLVLEQFVDVGDKAWGSRSTYSGGSDDFQDSLNFYEMAIMAGAHEYATAISLANFVDPPPMRVYFKEMGLGRLRMLELWREMVSDKVVRRGKEDEPFIRERSGFPEYVEPDEDDVVEDEPVIDPVASTTTVTTTNGQPVPEVTT